MERAILTGAMMADVLAGALPIQGHESRPTNLIHARLVSACLTRAELRQAKLTRADLAKADLRGADLSGASLCEAVLLGADMREARLEGADFTRCVGFLPPVPA